jgi:hypothetical protein
LLSIKIIRFTHYGKFELENIHSNAYLNLCRIFYIIKSLKDTISLQMILCIYYAHFQAHLQYGIIFWGYASDSINIFHLQKKVIRLISGIGRLVSCRSVFRDYKILTVPSLYILETLYFIKKHSTHLKSNEQLYDYNTRGKTNYHKLSCNTSQYQKSVTNMVVKLYNCMPNI